MHLQDAGRRGPAPARAVLPGARSAVRGLDPTLGGRGRREALKRKTRNNPAP